MLIGIRHAALPVQDLKRALAFYIEHFGFQPYLISDKDWAMLTLGGTSLSLMPISRKSQQQNSDLAAAIGPARHLGIQVQSKLEVDELYRKLKAKGYPHIQAPKLHRDSSYGFYFKDTEGNGMELIFIPYVPNPETQAAAPGIVLFAHGSSDPQWRMTFEKLLEQLKFHYPSSLCELAYMELGIESAEPTLEHAVFKLGSAGCSQILVAPVFLSSAGHVERDILLIVDRVRLKLKSQFPKLEIRVSAPLGESPLVREAFTAAAIAAAQELRARS